MENFKLWLKTNYNFDCEKSPFYLFVLDKTFKRLSDTSIDGLPYFEHHRNRLFQRILPEYILDLLFFLKQIPPAGTPHEVVVDSVVLNQLRYIYNLNFTN